MLNNTKSGYLAILKTGQIAEIQLNRVYLFSEVAPGDWRRSGPVPLSDIQPIASTLQKSTHLIFNNQTVRDHFFWTSKIKSVLSFLKSD